ncbi:hypothetical protein ABT024_39705, partial [Streptomyces sp. NPDC002812]|uniref:hypothetical protein n=1 Tax=Streptomyces sp. NPDC002812 TaxID=3154434 RepID=UPI00331C1BB0
QGIDALNLFLQSSYFAPEAFVVEFVVDGLHSGRISVFEYGVTDYTFGVLLSLRPIRMKDSPLEST